MNEEPGKDEWTPNPGKYQEQWKKMWFDMVETRKFQITQVYGKAMAERYAYLKSERDYFLQWGKMPAHVVEEQCDKCDIQQAELVQAQVKLHHENFWAQADEQAAYERECFLERIRGRIKALERLPEYQRLLKDRLKLLEASEVFVAKYGTAAEAARTSGHGKKGKQRTVKKKNR